MGREKLSCQPAAGHSFEASHFTENFAPDKSFLSGPRNDSLDIENGHHQVVNCDFQVDYQILDVIQTYLYREWPWLAPFAVQHRLPGVTIGKSVDPGAVDETVPSRVEIATTRNRRSEACDIIGLAQRGAPNLVVGVNYRERVVY
jgi:hypothetical protein